MNTVWKFETARFRVELELERENNYQYDGDDEDGEIQARLDAGEYVAFTSSVVVSCDDVPIGRDSLSGSVYHYAEISEFWQAHRDKNPLNRNCEASRAHYGANIGHYFPDMVREAISDARMRLAKFEAYAAPHRFNLATNSHGNP